MIDFKVQKGIEGENYVNDVLDKVLEKMDYTFITVRNKIIPFESVYGKSGYLSAEFDFIVFTPYYVYIIEVKNESYSEQDYSNRLWVLKNGTKVSNPISQNHNHKQVFCSELNVPLHKVITIEILLENVGFEVKKTNYANDYVLCGTDFTQDLLYLFSSESDEILDYQKIHDSFLRIVKKCRVDSRLHQECLDRTETIETRIKNVLGYIPFHRTDIVKCDRCGTGKLVFRDMKYKKRGGVNNTMHYALGCTNYRNNSINCEGLIYVDKDKDNNPFRDVKSIRIEERNGWGKELVNRTVLDEINELNRKYEDLRKQLNNMTYLESRLNEKEKTVDDLEIKNSQLEKYNKELIRDLSRYKKIIGPIYKLKKE